MVLTAEELSLAKVSQDGRIKINWSTRQTTTNFVTQCCCDREIQRYLEHKGTQAYKFNCNIVHQASKFTKISAISDHGWSDEINGPIDRELFRIYCNLRISPYPKGTRSPLSYECTELNNLNKAVNENHSLVGTIKEQDNDERDTGCFASFFMCLFS